MKWNKKCRFFDERYACDTLTSENYKSCEECRFAQEYSKKILIIKLGAIGDVLRTTFILPLLKKKYGSESLIYWMTNPISVDFLKDNNLIDKVLQYNLENAMRIQQEKFDILFALEIDTPSTLLANLVKADEKYGYFFDNGTTSCFNQGAEAYLKTAFLNHIKIKNRRTYQDLISKACKLDYNKEKPMLNLTEKEMKFGEEFKLKHQLSHTDKIIGINISSSDRWASRFFSNTKIKQLVRKLYNKYKIIILAGPEEIEKRQQLIKELEQEQIFIISNNPKNTLKEFAAVINLCNVIICGDTMVLHLASALNKKIIALFFVTSPYEIEDYNLMTKLISPLLEDYFYINKYVKELEDSITIEEILKALDSILIDKNMPHQSL